ncbi:MAG TPA: hypothetical protein PLN53_03865 [Terricaulis sp.]|nr:hypothetical protein [Terricaulis sp.]
MTEADETDLALSPYYLNTRRLEILGESAIPNAAQLVPLFKNSDQRVDGMRVARRIASRLLKAGAILNLTEELAASARDGERILAMTWDVCVFKDVGKAYTRARDGKHDATASFSATLNLGTDLFAASGELTPDHYYSDTTMNVLSGRKRMLIAGMFEFKGSKVEISPYIIGELVRETGVIAIGYASEVRVHPVQIDAFRSAMEDATAPTKADLDAVRSMSEAEVKAALAEIIGEVFVPKDWGGEKSDLQTNRLTIGGQPVSAAFLLKGPAVRGEMHPANLGKRGDQLIRAFDEPVQLIVVQHCDKIANTVVRQAEALAYDPRNPRRYCIIDGAETAIILKAHGKLKGVSEPAEKRNRKS